MSRPVGRHRAPRRSPLHRPAVVVTASMSALALTAAGYAGATSGLSAGGATAQLSADPAPQAADSIASVGTAHSDVDGTRAAIRRAAQARAQVAGQQRVAAARMGAEAVSRRQAADRASRSAVLRSLPNPTSAESYEQPETTSPAKSDDAASSTTGTESAPSQERAAAPSTSREADRPVATTGDPRSVARAMVASNGWGPEQFGCLDKLWMKESGWRVGATNPSSGAYGIPQSLPGSKMASAGSAWRTDAATQIRWGLGYIKGRYGSPCAAWGHSQSVNWY